MSSVTLRRCQGVGRLELNRPDAAASSTSRWPASWWLVTSVGEDDGIAAIVVTGAGARICGGDVVAMAAQSDPTS